MNKKKPCLAAVLQQSVQFILDICGLHKGHVQEQERTASEQGGAGDAGRCWECGAGVGGGTAPLPRCPKKDT